MEEPRFNADVEVAADRLPPRGGAEGLVQESVARRHHSPSIADTNPDSHGQNNSALAILCQFRGRFTLAGCMQRIIVPERWAPRR
jgi:hypothetical protein